MSNQITEHTLKGITLSKCM